LDLPAGQRRPGTVGETGNYRDLPADL
jgi:hypothetical protein